MISHINNLYDCSIVVYITNVSHYNDNIIVFTCTCTVELFYSGHFLESQQQHSFT